MDLGWKNKKIANEHALAMEQAKLDAENDKALHQEKNKMEEKVRLAEIEAQK